MGVQRKKILFIGYGGGHITILNKIAQSFVADEGIEVKIIPLNGAIPFVAERYTEHIFSPLSKFADLFDDEIDKILFYGGKLLNENYNPNIGISKLESMFYLGLSFYDLVKQYDERSANIEYTNRKRQAFLPVGTMTKILKFLRPDIIITTGSPRFEVATIISAKNLGIKTMQFLDSFGDDYPLPSADHIVVMNNTVAQKLINKGIDNSMFHPLGQPILDETIEKVAEINISHLREKMRLPDKKVLLFGPHKNYIFNDDLSVKEELDGSEIHESVFRVLDEVASILDVQILIRPHPSDDINNYKKFIQEKPHYIYHPELSIYEAIAISDYSLSYCSTIVLQAVVCGKLSFTFNQNPNFKYPWPGYASKPFIYSVDHMDLKNNLLKHIKNQTAVSLVDFFETGAVNKVNELVRELIN